MKDQATHIRLIRDENGKPIEAEYHKLALRGGEIKSTIKFMDWAKANRIPVTGDWPDREVFARDEVEPEKQLRMFDDEKEESYWTETEASKSMTESEFDELCAKSPDLYRKTLRLKAKQEEQPRYEVLFNDPVIQGWHEVPVERIINIEEGMKKGLIRVKQEEQPKQVAKTADLVDYLKEQSKKGAAGYLRKKLGENFWSFPQGYAQSEIFAFMQEFSTQEKQQYQQEIIEKLEEAAQSCRHDEIIGITLAIEIIK